ncbi:DUF983 domain-containing protein [Candidatus Trichorickettsia mobilis]|uniref:DUF983 domain-containing protein n=1 Tax=Candidatus Trichorickettsia mobilis TaxID=1346319 RepID=UPI00292DB344|nr:DUF983 domain-containing protein [Candidatus Trichorickettsia mobilis]
MKSTNNPTSQNFWLIVGRALFGFCPSCGKGRLFTTYLKQVEHCMSCNECFGRIKADDGPAWLTIFMVGHILIPILLTVAPRTTWPEWVSMIVWPGLALILAIIILPRAKGLFIAIIWRTNINVKADK